MSEPEQSELTPEQRHRRTRTVWVLVTLLVVVLVLLTPPFINVNRLQRRIASSMGQSLGRPVHLGDVSIHVLPMPGFTIQDLVVSEDPSFGAEPVIRAGTVSASIRVSSLWRRHVEFGTIRFEDPSVNLVRRPDGHWNIESILLHAAQEDAAPTAQSHPGPNPRVPYIEANRARLNIKIGDEKKPFALTEADFSLWLPSPQQWRLRLEGKPTRTDTSVSDTGLLGIEATLDRAPRLADVPVDATLVWRRAPLGEASHILSGRDMGWRGDVEATAALHGTLSDAATTATLKLKNVRRSDFIPLKMLTLSAECSGHLSITAGRVTEPACTLPTDTDKPSEPEPGAAQQAVLAATADSLDLNSLHAAGLRFGMTNVPDAWLLDWARLFSQRVPADLAPAGKVSGTVTATEPGGHLNGEFHDVSSAGGTRPEPRTYTATLSGSTLSLQPVNVASPDKPPLLLTLSVTDALYTLQLAGTATGAELEALRAQMPPLGDGADAILTAANDVPAKVNIICTRTWTNPQTCVSFQSSEPARKTRTR